MMIQDSPPPLVDIPTEDVGTYDIVIVGAGSAGCTLACRLAMGGLKILVLEAGQHFRSGGLRSFLTKRPGSLAIMYEYPKFLPLVDWGTVTVPQKAVHNRQMAMTRGLGVGGSSNINGMICIRGHRACYDAWEKAGNIGWGYDHILPYLKKLEATSLPLQEHRGSSGMLPLMHQKDNSSPAVNAYLEAACDVTGLPLLEDLNIAEPEGFSHYELTCHQAQRQNTAITFMKIALKTKNVRLLDCAHFHRLEFDGKQVKSVLFGREGKQFRAHVGKEVIISSGTMGSPQALMLSGLGPSEHLLSKGINPLVDIPGVGHNLQDHPSIHIRWRARNTERKATPWFYMMGMLRASVSKTGWYGKAFMEAGGFVKSDPSKVYPDLQSFFLPWGYTEPNNDNPHTMHIPREESMTVVISLITPKSIGKVEIASRNPYDQPLVDPAFLEDHADLEALRNGIILYRKIAYHPVMKPYLIDEAFPGSNVEISKHIDDYILRCCRTTYHPTGTCKMGVIGEDSKAVVDDRLRVRHIKGVRVVDASIMPTIIHGNTNIPTIMIAEKAADMILRDIKK